ncbi:hypothetical protein [Streptosporangium sp. NPDC006930]
MHKSVVERRLAQVPLSRSWRLERGSLAATLTELGDMMDLPVVY